MSSQPLPFTPTPGPTAQPPCLNLCTDNTQNPGIPSLQPTHNSGPFSSLTLLQSLPLTHLLMPWQILPFLPLTTFCQLAVLTRSLLQQPLSLLYLSFPLSVEHILCHNPFTPILLPQQPPFPFSLATRSSWLHLHTSTGYLPWPAQCLYASTFHQHGTPLSWFHSLSPTPCSGAPKLASPLITPATWPTYPPL